MVRITGLVSRAPGGPQLTTGLRTVWMSSTGGLGNTDNTGDTTEKSNRRAALSDPSYCELQSHEAKLVHFRSVFCFYLVNILDN